MSTGEETGKRGRKESLLVIFIIPLGILLIFIIGQIAIRLDPTWMLPTDMRSKINPNADFDFISDHPLLEPILSGILTQPVWGDLFLTPGAELVVPPGTLMTSTPTSVPPATLRATNTPALETPPSPSATIAGQPSVPPPNRPTDTATSTSTSTPTATATRTFTPTFTSTSTYTPTFTSTIPPILNLDLQISKTDSATTYAAGSTLTYLVRVTNNGPSAVTGATITDDLPIQVSSWDWACTAVTNAAGCDAVTGSAARFQDTVNLQSGGFIEYTVRAYVSANATGNLANTASVAAPSGYNDTVPGNNSVTDTDIPYIDLQITKTDNVTSYNAGGSLTYTITVRNNSTFDLSGVTVSDNIPATFNSWTWTCSSQNGGATGCDPSPGNKANFTDTVNLPKNGSSIVYSVNANILSNAVGPLSNTASVNVPGGYSEATPGDNSSTDTDTSTSSEPDIGMPDGDWTTPAEGGSLTFTFSPGILADGDVGVYDFVYYERIADLTVAPALQWVELDWVIIEISPDGSNWYQVFYWGNGSPDKNSNVDIDVIGGTEADNRSFFVADGILYNRTGVAIDIDAIPGIVTGTRYPWMRITAPVSPGNDPADIDAIQPWYP